MFHEERNIRSFEQVINKKKPQCSKCGLIENHCLCPKIKALDSQVQFVLLTHEREMTRTTNTGRLIEDAIANTVNIVWTRNQVDDHLMKWLLSKEHDVYLIFPGDREEEKKKLIPYKKTNKKTNKKTVFLIIDGTWKEARKILRKSDYLHEIPILDINLTKKTDYFLRRNSDDNHLCTAEVGIALLDLVGEKKSSEYLEDYYNGFLSLYKEGRLHEDN